MKYRWIRGFVLVLFVMVLSACGGSGASSGSQQVPVTETDFKITSSVTSFIPGTSYHFVVTNNGHTAHEFMIMPKAERSMSGMPMGNMDSMALAKVDNIAPGQTKTVDYTFPSSAAGSHPQFACYYPGHYEAGMKLDVTVNS
ncbi:MAG: hypothetical protein ACJ8DI_25315 [Ktedonobacteraceae bacterium]